jgi:hypothetical protein
MTGYGTGKRDERTAARQVPPFDDHRRGESENPQRAIRSQDVRCTSDCHRIGALR